MPRGALAFALAVAAAACDRCHPAPAPGVAARGERVDALLRSLGEALCATEKRCDPRPRACRWTEVIATPGPLGAWAGAAAVKADRARPDEGAFAACEKAVRDAPCDRVLRLFADLSVPLPFLEQASCHDLFDGASADGEPCCAGEECAGGACEHGRCLRARARTGTLRTAGPDDSCDPTGEPFCTASQTCARTPEGRRCSPWRPRAEGEVCQDGTDCAPPLVCGPRYACARKGAEGDSCCPEGESCTEAICRDDLYCDLDARACKARLAEGSACPERVGRACAEGLACRGGRCGKPGAALALCRAHGECTPGLACAAGRCAPRGDAGAACGDDRECREGFVCNPFSPRVCIPPAAPLLCESW